MAGCTPGRQANWTELPREYSYGRTEVERQRDRELFAESYFSEHELVTIAVLCDIILPSDHPNGGALDAGLPDFVEFIVKDREHLKVPVRGGIAWLDSYAIAEFGGGFHPYRRAPTARDQRPHRLAGCGRSGIAAGHRLLLAAARSDLGPATILPEQGLRDLGYQGNAANVWDGRPRREVPSGARHGIRACMA